MRVGEFHTLDAAACRLIDVVAAGCGLAALGPAFVCVGLWVKAEDRGPVFYRARRVGRDGKAFDTLKFRTMRVGSDRLGPAITISGDDRVTRVGRHLRRLKLDELPQLWNVLVGDMSLVGPRPEDPKYVPYYSEAQRAVFDARPGITSPASLKFRNEADVLRGLDWERKYREEVLPQKLAMDLEYLRRRTVVSDLALVFRTIGALVGKGAGG